MTRCPYPSRAWLKAVPFALTFAIAACATQAPSASRQPAASTSSPAPLVSQTATGAATTPPQVVPALPLPKPPSAEVRAAFVSETASKYGLDPAYIDSILARAQIRDSTITAMSRPAETKPWRDYRPIFVTQQRIDGGRAFLAEHREQLAKVEAQYGVPAEIIVAILGVETNWGSNTGKAPVLDALYTLAFNYPRTNLPDKIARENQRETYFRDELGQLFALGKDTGFDIATLNGSYAGAMGWGQFMPSSYRLYAVDGNGDGKRDLFTDLDDVFASVANYFVQKGGWVARAAGDGARKLYAGRGAAGRLQRRSDPHAGDAGTGRLQAAGNRACRHHRRADRARWRGRRRTLAHLPQLPRDLELQQLDPLRHRGVSVVAVDRSRA